MKDYWIVTYHKVNRELQHPYEIEVGSFDFDPFKAIHEAKAIIERLDDAIDDYYGKQKEGEELLIDADLWLMHYGKSNE